MASIDPGVCLQMGIEKEGKVLTTEFAEGLGFVPAELRRGRRERVDLISKQVFPKLNQQPVTEWGKMIEEGLIDV